MPRYSTLNHTPKQLCEMRGSYYHSNRNLCRQLLHEKAPGDTMKKVIGEDAYDVLTGIASAPVGGIVVGLKMAAKFPKIAKLLGLDDVKKGKYTEEQLKRWSEDPQKLPKEYRPPPPKPKPPPKEKPKTVPSHREDTKPQSGGTLSSYDALRRRRHRSG